jgi:predicted nucleotidyltransferase
MVEESDIRQVARRIGEAARAERVLLFGSYARGTASPDSDVDLMVVAQSDLPRFKRSRALYRAIRPHPFPMDILVFTPEEVERGKEAKTSFVSAILDEARTVYERGDCERQ